jgi:hypothetical protein
VCVASRSGYGLGEYFPGRASKVLLELVQSTLMVGAVAYL